MTLAPEDPRITFWHAMALLANGRSDDAEPMLEASLRAEPRMLEFARRYLDAGHGAALMPIVEVRVRPR